MVDIERTGEGEKIETYKEHMELLVKIMAMPIVVEFRSQQKFQ